MVSNLNAMIDEFRTPPSPFMAASLHLSRWIAATGMLALMAACAPPDEAAKPDRLAYKQAVDGPAIAKVLRSQLTRFKNLQIDYARIHQARAWHKKKRKGFNVRHEDSGYVRLSGGGRVPDYEVTLISVVNQEKRYREPALKRVVGTAYRERLPEEQQRSSPGWTRVKDPELGTGRAIPILTGDQRDARVMTDPQLYAFLAEAGTVTGKRRERMERRDTWRYTIETPFPKVMDIIELNRFYVYIDLVTFSSQQDPPPEPLHRKLLRLSQGKPFSVDEMAKIRRGLKQHLKGDSSTMTLWIDTEDRLIGANLTQTARGETENVTMTLSRWGKVTIKAPTRKELKKG